MVVGLCTGELVLSEIFSLKNKRGVMKSLMVRLRTRFNISISEVQNHDIWRRSTLAFVCVSVSSRSAHALLSKAINVIEDESQIIVECVEIEII